MRFLIPVASLCFLFSQPPQYIDGVAAIVEDHIVLKSDLMQMVNMAAIQNRVDPQKNPEDFASLQQSVIELSLIHI